MRILVVEDEEVLAEALVEALQRDFHAVRWTRRDSSGMVPSWAEPDTAPRTSVLGFSREPGAPPGQGGGSRSKEYRGE
jgi:hypothetical protein